MAVRCDPSDKRSLPTRRNGNTYSRYRSLIPCSSTSWTPCQLWVHVSTRPVSGGLARDRDTGAAERGAVDERGPSAAEQRRTTITDRICSRSINRSTSRAALSEIGSTSGSGRSRSGRGARFSPSSPPCRAPHHWVRGARVGQDRNETRAARPARRKSAARSNTR